LANIAISPPKKRVVTKTMTKVELTIRLELGEKRGSICKLKPKAMAPKIKVKPLDVVTKLTYL